MRTTEVKSMTKRSLAIVALAALIAWPSAGEAAAKKKPVRHKAAPAAQQWRAPSWAYVPDNRRRPSPNPKWDVYYSDGVYAGSDPDPHVRDMLQRDDARYHGAN
jgi:hypothetical protein